MAVLLLSALTELQSRLLQITQPQPLYAAVTGGLIMGIGFLVLFRHRCSLGGLGILALYLQDRFGWRAGKVQMGRGLLHPAGGPGHGGADARAVVGDRPPWR
ncbi:hypothetical protein ALISP_0262 [Alicycliphilus sp. B1]|nr:hypothetical protein ALISP_0262 [Alicycliphilus sp. B1]